TVQAPSHRLQPGRGHGGKRSGRPLMRWPALALVGSLLLLAGCARLAPPARAEDDPPDPAVEAYLEWAVAVDGAVRGAGLALDESLARRGRTAAWRERVDEALGVWEGAYQDAQRRQPPGRLARGHGLVAQALWDYTLAAELIRRGVACDDEDLIRQGLAEEQYGAAQLDTVVGLLRQGVEPNGPASRGVVRRGVPARPGPAGPNPARPAAH